MKAWTRWQDWATIALGVILGFAPWMFGAVSITSFAVNAWFVGVLSIGIALLALYQPQRWIAEWLILILGVWLFLSPWSLSFATQSAAAWTAWIIGLLLVVVSGLTLAETRSSRATMPM